MSHYMKSNQTLKRVSSHVVQELLFSLFFSLFFSDSPSVLRVDLCLLGAKQTLAVDSGVLLPRCPLSRTLSPSAPAKCHAGTHGGDIGVAAELE